MMQARAMTAKRINEKANTRDLSQRLATMEKESKKLYSEMRVLIQHRKRNEESRTHLLNDVAEIKKETHRQSIALFATDDSNDFGIIGLVPTVREWSYGLKWIRRGAVAMAALISTLAGLIGWLIQMLYSAGLLKGLM